MQNESPATFNFAFPSRCLTCAKRKCKASEMQNESPATFNFAYPSRRLTCAKAIIKVAKVATMVKKSYICVMIV